MLAILALSPTPTADFKVEIRDFDQTVIGNPAHDLIRLGLSLAAAAVVSDLPGLTIAEILEAMIAQYEAAFSAASDKPGHLEEPKTIRKVNRRAADASWTTLAAEDMDGQNFKLPLGKSFWPLLVEERREIERLFRNEEIRRLVTEGEGRRRRCGCSNDRRRLLEKGVQLPRPSQIRGPPSDRI